MKTKFKSILYVNYSPYENAGYILDFLTLNYRYVFLYSVGFHDLGENRSKNVLNVYENGRLISKRWYFHLKIQRGLEYLFVPVRSVINLIQIFVVAKYLKAKYGKIDNYFSVNAFTAWVGLFLRGKGYVNRTVFWVWDYYPLKHTSSIVVFMRWLYWQFDRIAMYSDDIVFLNQRLLKLHMQKNKYLKKRDLKIIPIGTKPVFIRRKVNKNETIKLVFLGVLKKSQGLDFLFDSYNILKSKFSGLKLEIVGGGPDSNYFISRSKKEGVDAVFYGKVNEKKVDKIISASHIGIATYKPDRGNVSYFGDPSKVKRYISFSVPIITTDVFEFSEEVKSSSAGILIKYGDKKEFVRSISKIISNYDYYSKNAYVLSKRYDYKNIYKKII